MRGHEEIEIIGNVGKDPEMRFTPSGVPVTSFSVAVNKVLVDADGNKTEKVKWFRVTCWRKLAEITAQYVKKGTAVFVKGEVEASSFTDREGTARASLELTASKVQFLGGRDGEGEEGSRGGSDPAENDLPF